MIQSTPPDEKDVEEIRKIVNILNQDEHVLLVARQYKHKPGGARFTPNTIYATDRRIIIRDPYRLGAKENITDIPYHVISTAKVEKGVFSSSVKLSTYTGELDIDAIPKDKAEDLLEIIRGTVESRMAGRKDDEGIYHHEELHMQEEPQQGYNELQDSNNTSIANNHQLICQNCGHRNPTELNYCESCNSELIGY